MVVGAKSPSDYDVRRVNTKATATIDVLTISSRKHGICRKQSNMLKNLRKGTLVFGTSVIKSPLALINLASSFLTAESLLYSHSSTF